MILPNLWKHGENAGAFSSKPQYAVLIMNYYSKLYLHAMNSYENISESVLNEENDFLMDSYDRQNSFKNTA
jgi:hypothetical protein